MEEEAEELGGLQAKEFRALAARANYLAADRADIQFAVKELCRGMAKPTRGDWRKIKRLGRYLIGKPRVVVKYVYQEENKNITGYTDSNWAGCKKTAKSTSGDAITRGSIF